MYEQDIDELRPGEVVGAYEVISLVARGGMGCVYRARNRLTDELRAIKIMSPDLASNEIATKRFMREIRIASKIRHPNFVHVYEPAMDGVRMILPMELLEGKPLSDHLRAREHLSPTRIASILLPICDALSALHEQQIVHRDIKPSNLFMSRDGNGQLVPKVLDFGVARSQQQLDGATVVGSVVGSMHYMSPEQARGEQVDARTDQYALGVVLYQMLTGQRPYESASDNAVVFAQVVQGALFAPPSQIAQVDPRVERVVMIALQSDRNRRFPTVREFAENLRAAWAPAMHDADATRIAPPPSASTGSFPAAPLSEPRRSESTIDRGSVEVGSRTPTGTNSWLIGAFTTVVALIAIVAFALRAEIVRRNATTVPPAMASSAIPQEPMFAQPTTTQAAPASTVAMAIDSTATIPTATDDATKPSAVTSPNASPPSQKRTPSKKHVEPAPMNSASSRPVCTPRPGIPCPP